MTSDAQPRSGDDRNADLYSVDDDSSDASSLDSDGSSGFSQIRTTSKTSGSMCPEDEGSETSTTFSAPGVGHGSCRSRSRNNNNHSNTENSPSSFLPLAGDADFDSGARIAEGEFHSFRSTSVTHFLAAVGDPGEGNARVDSLGSPEATDDIIEADHESRTGSFVDVISTKKGILVMAICTAMFFVLDIVLLWFCIKPPKAE
ncbi:unnamed protein product [Pseudo-nitzschia multistriata]|uniref:Uncharacterized protein n=1 Tax=Pseudo-nitzschia multistriata TaxID=183589 RepID=A0A448ZEZ5_9STRA|nr:unnamed protein product [Pseudo-nitzschia multistriata]